MKRQLPRTRSLRRKSGQQPGVQVVHTGETLHLVAAPDKVVEHRPGSCATRQAALEAGAVVVGCERRQVQELPPVLATNPPPPHDPRRGGRIKQSPVRTLLERVWLGQAQALAFLDNLSVPFDNHQAERALRLLKTQRKVSGGFRSDAGAEAFARPRSYLSTLRKQGVALLNAVHTLFSGCPLYPALG